MLPSSASANLTYPKDNFHCFSVRLWTLFCRKYNGFEVVRVPQKCSALLHKKQAKSTQGTRIASENKSLRKQEIVPQGAYLLLFLCCAAFHFLLNLVDCPHQRFNIQVGVDRFGERHGTGVSDNLLEYGLAYMGLCQRGDAGVPGTVRRLAISKLLHYAYQRTDTCRRVWISAEQYRQIIRVGMDNLPAFFRT